MAIRITGVNSGLDTDSIIKSLTTSYQSKIDKIKKQQSNIQYKMDGWSNLNNKIYSFYGITLSNNRYQSTFSTTKAKASTDDISITTSSQAVIGNHSLEVVSKAQTGYITGSKLSNTSKNTKLKDLGLDNETYKFNNNEITIDDETTIESFIAKLNKTGVNATFDDTQKRFFISAKEMGTSNDFDISIDKTDQKLLEVLGMTQSYYLDDDGNYYKDKDMTSKIEDSQLINDIKNGKAAVRISGKDSEILLDGVSYKNNKNEISVNGMNIIINNTSDKKINISVTKDTNNTLNQIKDFINEYNSLVQEMSKAYNTSNEGYEPLTDEEKESMSESQINKWEDKLKDSALYKDSTLNSFIAKLRTGILSNIQLNNGSSKSLSNYGISTKSYLASSVNDRYTLEIDEDKLKESLEEDENGTTEFFSSLANKMYKTIDKAMNNGATTLSSKYKIYNDKSMSLQISNYDKEINKLEEKQTAAQEKYYKQFAAMETALAKINSQTNYFNSFFNTKI